MLTVIALLASVQAVAQASPGRVVLESPVAAKLHFDGPIGQRIEAGTRDWLIRAPAANPGMLGMFRLRDRQPPPNLVPWAGEFVGKYLISAIQTLSMVEDPELEKTVQTVVGELIASQAEDGYLGPFPKAIRLTANWDLWGHYHCLLALLMWHERTGQPAALDTCRKAADLICRTFLGTKRRVVEVGSDEMNLAVIHALGWLHRKTGAARYLQMMREIEKDWQRAGDYFRTGLAGVDFYRIPRPRWESLHDLQGLVELYLITGDPRYRTAFLNHWQSIRRWDRHNNGAFSSSEQATGDPYQPTAIETCCTVAWMAITLDALRLTGDPLAADELELSTFNGMLGALHPSGSWCTYNTPMNGTREASHHAIVFQARSGTPDLNCCSVNGPRGLGMLSQWAVMRPDAGLAINYYGPMQATLKLPDGNTVTIRQETQYPLDGKVRIQVSPEKPAEFAVKLRVPAWSSKTELQVPGGDVKTVSAGQYVEVRRQWNPGDAVELQFDMRLRYESGDGQMAGRISVYRGPILLAYDVRHNAFDEADLPVLTPSTLEAAKASFPQPDPEGHRMGRFAPWLLVDVPVGKDRTLRLCDYASAGSTGSQYVSWLPARQIVPPPPVPSSPAEGAGVPAGAMVFAWRKGVVAAGAPAAQREYVVVVAETPGFEKPVLEIGVKSASRVVVSAEQAGRLKPKVDYFWKVVAKNEFGATESIPPAKRFHIDPTLPPLTPDQFSEYGEGPGGVLVAADLAGDPKPSYGRLARAQGLKPAAGIDASSNGAVQLDGQTGMIVYAVRAFPAHEYTVSVWVAHEHKEDRLGQVFSAWDHVMDDPLRICLEKGKLFARVETGGSHSTQGVSLEAGRWHHVAAVKAGGRITLYLDGKPAGTMFVPVEVHSAARDFALGGNPHYTGQSEHLPCRLARFAMYVRAFTPEEIAALCEKQRAAR